MREWDSITQFTDQLFGHLRRVDQRRWAHAYMQGLLTTPGKKSVRQLAAAATDSPTAHQALHQFINESPWEWEPVCDQLRQWVENRVQPQAWTIAPVVLPKRGEKSCGVHRRFIMHTGRTVNCQVGIGVFVSTDEGELPLGWGLLLPEPWTSGPLRERARIPHNAALPAERHVLHLVDLLMRHTQNETVPVVVGLDGFLDGRVFISELHRHRRDFIVAVPEALSLAPFNPRSRGRRPQVTPAAQILSEGRADGLPLAGRSGRATARDALVQIPGAAAAGSQPQPLRLLARSDTRHPGDSRLWITNMVHRPVDELLRHTDRHAATSETVTLLERGFGLRDFEGRSFPGWHHHMTLVSAAFIYSRLAADPDQPAVGPGPAHSTASDGWREPPLMARVPRGQGRSPRPLVAA